MKKLTLVNFLPAEPDKTGLLTISETRILALAASGCTNKRIAYHFGIKEQTVKNHMMSILHKLSALDRANAVAIAMRAGIIQ